MPRSTPLLSFDFEPPTRRDVSIHESDESPKKWYHYLPLCTLLFLMVAPHPSLLLVLVNHYLRTMHDSAGFLVHLLVTYTLTFLAFSSLIVCIARDPGPVPIDKSSLEEQSGGRDDLGLREALMSMPEDEDEMSPVKWCRECWAPKPERTHHCRICDRCVLKMDHHCPWLGSRCVGYRTYPAFFHFITCITLLSTYIGFVGGNAFWWSFNNPGLVLDQATPIHELFLTAAGVIFGVVVGSFTVYHMYLITTNQTTLESLSPFLLLRHLPPLPASLRLSDPPLEHELSYNQRSLVKDAHSAVRIYNVGWRKNWAQVFGWSKPHGWLYLFMYGGSSKGDGRSFPRNPRAEEMLSKLASRLATADKEA